MIGNQDEDISTPPSASIQVAQHVNRPVYCPAHNIG